MEDQVRTYSPTAIAELLDRCCLYLDGSMRTSNWSAVEDEADALLRLGVIPAETAARSVILHSGSTRLLATLEAVFGLDAYRWQNISRRSLWNELGHAPYPPEALAGIVSGFLAANPEPFLEDAANTLAQALALRSAPVADAVAAFLRPGKDVVLDAFSHHGAIRSLCPDTAFLSARLLKGAPRRDDAWRTIFGLPSTSDQLSRLVFLLKVGVPLCPTDLECARRAFAQDPLDGLLGAAATAHGRFRLMGRLPEPDAILGMDASQLMELARRISD